LADLLQKIRELAEELLQPINGFVTDLHIVPGNQRKLIQVFIDTDTGISIDQCAEISKLLGIAIEQKNLIADSYVLQVSSPGLKKPLKLLRQYHKNIGRKFRIRFRRNDKTDEIIGSLSNIENDQLSFITEKDIKYVIQFNEIIEAIETLPW
jgi:ribosome maturation factor RimP